MLSLSFHMLSPSLFPTISNFPSPKFPEPWYPLHGFITTPSLPSIPRRTQQMHPALSSHTAARLWRGPLLLPSQQRAAPKNTPFRSRDSHTQSRITPHKRNELGWDRDRFEGLPKLYKNSVRRPLTFENKRIKKDKISRNFKNLLKIWSEIF